MTLLRFHSSSEYRPPSGFIVPATRAAETVHMVGATPSSVSFSRPFDVCQHGAATYARYPCLTVQRPRPFSGPRRVTPPCAYLPCFMQEHPWVSCLQSVSLPDRHAVLIALRCPPCCFSHTHKECEPQLRGFEPVGESVPSSGAV
jgi:hypothetical protein